MGIIPISLASKMRWVLVSVYLLPMVLHGMIPVVPIRRREGDANNTDAVPESIRVHVLLRKETPGLQALHDAHICAYP